MPSPKKRKAAPAREPPIKVYATAEERRTLEAAGKLAGVRRISSYLLMAGIERAGGKVRA